MQPTFGAVIRVARLHLGDERGSVFKDAFLLQWAKRVFDEMDSVFKTFQLQQVLAISAPFTLTAGVTEIDPTSVASLSGFGDPSKLEEHNPPGTSDPYTEVKMVALLPQRDASDKLREYTMNQGKLQFVGATGDVELRMHFYASGSGDTLADSATINVDDSLNFLGAATAAKAGGGKGYTQEAEAAKSLAYGPNNPNPLAILGGYLQSLVEPKMRIEQQTPVVPPLYRAGMFRR